MEYIKARTNKTLYVLVGIPASGKSHIGRKLASDKIEYVSRDEVRFSLIKEGDEYFSKETKVFNEFIDRIQGALDCGKSAIADATHISKGSRAKLLRNLDLEGVEVVAIHIDCAFANCLARNSQREGRARVPDDAMISMHRFFSRPRKQEGFSDIVVINNRWEMNL